jgi:hypothetical protein
LAVLGGKNQAERWDKVGVILCANGVMNWSPVREPWSSRSTMLASLASFCQRFSIGAARRH